MELRFAEFGRLVGRWLVSGITGDWGRRGGHLNRWCCRGYGGGGGEVFVCYGLVFEEVVTLRADAEAGGHRGLAGLEPVSDVSFLYLWKCVKTDLAVRTCF